MNRFMWVALLLFATVLGWNTHAASPISGYVIVYDAGGSPVVPPGAFPITGEIDPGAGLFHVDPFSFLGPPMETTTLEFLAEGIHSRPDGLGGVMSAQVDPGQIGVYLALDWAPDHFPTFMVWDVSNSSGHDTFTAADSDGDGIPGQVLSSGPLSEFSFTYEFATVATEPGIRVSIDALGGALQECSESGGSEISMTANVSLLNDGILDTLDWTVDGDPAGSTDGLSAFLSLGTHTVDVTARLVTGQLASDSLSITIRDTQPPALSVAFVNEKTGLAITEVAGNQTHRVKVNIMVDDLCDQSPVTEGIATPVHGLQDGDVIEIKSEKQRVVLPTSAVDLRATATDASGNRSSGVAMLKVIADQE